MVGPNGSGKSNTIDALLFVFGYRATKMRQGKLSELIHNSGAAPAPEETDEDGVGMPVRAPAVDGPDGGEFDSDEDSDEAYTNKKKGKKSKAKANKSAPEPQAGLIDSCTVEVWFREIIDLVSTTNLSTACLHALTQLTVAFSVLACCSLAVTSSRSCPTRSWSWRGQHTATTRANTRKSPSAPVHSCQLG